MLENSYRSVQKNREINRRWQFVCKPVCFAVADHFIGEQRQMQQGIADDPSIGSLASVNVPGNGVSNQRWHQTIEDDTPSRTKRRVGFDFNLIDKIPELINICREQVSRLCGDILVNAISESLSVPSSKTVTSET